MTIFLHFLAICEKNCLHCSTGCFFNCKYTVLYVRIKQIGCPHALASIFAKTALAQLAVPAFSNIIL